jgi:hypothetical protein
MTTKKIVIPEGMLQAGRAAYSAYVTAETGASRVLEAGLRWLSENPIKPSPKQLQDIADENGRGTCYPESIDPYVVGFQKRMFVKPEPTMIGNETLESFCGRYQTIGEAVAEAFQLGQQSAGEK